METPAEVLTREEFALARWRFADGAALVAAVSGSGAHLADWLPWAVGGYTADDAAAYLRLTHGNWETGRAYEYAVRVGAELAGGIGVLTRDGGVELGYWLVHGRTGRGLITRAAASLIADAFRRGAGYVEIKHDELNVRSGAGPGPAGVFARPQGNRGPGPGAGVHRHRLGVAARPTRGRSSRAWRPRPRPTATVT
ncbi:GNAT family N-acetyltransferase [Amycolatopsis sp. NBC_00355]|uniref:GNAT family N-acetyltransferase n=1 Tax=Amycolatopsis sp. NBC_00355 TaxID=2975957 RepID=UPI002E25618D